MFYDDFFLFWTSLLQFSQSYFDLDEPSDLEKRPSLFVTYDGLQKKAEDLKNDEANAKSQLFAMDQSQSEDIAHL